MRKEEVFEGFLQTTKSGSGFVVFDDDDNEDVFINKKNIKNSIDGDFVVVQIIKKTKKRREGIILKTIKRGRSFFVGEVFVDKHFAFLVPENPVIKPHLYIRKEFLNGAKNGDKAIGEITVWPLSKKNPFGKIVSVLKNNSIDEEMISILVNNNLPFSFNKDVLKEAQLVSKKKIDYKKRRDFRNTTTFTIDPVDAKDFDDAISFKKLNDNRAEVGIHIADVSFFVEEGTVLDKEAFKRCNSVYLADRVVPMLPEKLSNEVCSLRPQEEKLVFSVVFEIDKEGVVYNKWFGKSLIFSDYRFTYDEVQKIIDGGGSSYKNEILFLNKISSALRSLRFNSGGLNIKSSETKFLFDNKGFPSNVFEKTSTEATILVEEFMLLTNKSVASFLKNQTSSLIYRCHDKPEKSKIDAFCLFIKQFNYEIDSYNNKTFLKKLNTLLQKVKKDDFEIIQSMAVRSMSKAKYETNNIGHYGLGFKNYTHFTSPIRRYADLMIHRILYKCLNKKNITNYNLKDICKETSKKERLAIKAERESIKYFQTLFVVDKIGKEYEGIIISATEFGLFIQIKSLFCEGFVSIKNIPGDLFYFDKTKQYIIGKNYNKKYYVGKTLFVRINDACTKKRKIYLEIISY